MDTIVLKFGGSSVADNIRLNLVAEKIIDLYDKNNNIVVVVSAQGKTTDRLIKEAKELSNFPDEREMDVLLSTGEQVTISKLSILLNRLGYEAISLTGWQAGIFTTNSNQTATIENIDTTRINKELENHKIVIVAGFQGFNEKLDITTFGRGGSDSTAVALAATLDAKHCYIFSDVDGVYSTDPNKIPDAKKLENLSYSEMLDISSEGAKVLHNRCVEIGEKFNIPIITKSTFNNKPGTVINEKIEDTTVKSIVKNDDIIYVNAKSKNYSTEIFNKIYNVLIRNEIIPKNLVNNSSYQLDISFCIKNTNLNKFLSISENDLSFLECSYHNVSKIALVGHGIMNDNTVLLKLMKIIELNNLNILNIDINESKIAILFKDIVQNTVLEQIHREVIH